MWTSSYSQCDIKTHVKLRNEVLGVSFKQQATMLTLVGLGHNKHHYWIKNYSLWSLAAFSVSTTSFLFQLLHFQTYCRSEKVSLRFYWKNPWCSLRYLQFSNSKLEDSHRFARTLQNPKAKFLNHPIQLGDFHTSGGVLPGAQPTGETRPMGVQNPFLLGPRTTTALQDPEHRVFAQGGFLQILWIWDIQKNKRFGSSHRAVTK